MAVAGRGRTSGVLTGPVVDLAGRLPLVARREGETMHGNLVVEETTVPASLQARWNDAYSAYLGALDAKGVDALAHKRVAALRSAEVAAVYLEMARTPNLGEWLLVAVTSCAEAFEAQAESWSAKPESGLRKGVRT